MQHHLLQKKLDKELPECVAQQALEDAKAKLAGDKRDIQLIETWHVSTIRNRMMEWQDEMFRLHKTCPTEQQVLFCDMKQSAPPQEQEIARILDSKESLVEAWYVQKQGLNNVHFTSNQKGTMRYMQFGFYSVDMDAKLRLQSLKGRHEFETNVRVALYIIRVQTQLPINVLKTIHNFIPDYLQHLAQEKDRIEKARPW
jgi:hypothetical protein